MRRGLWGAVLLVAISIGAAVPAAAAAPESPVRIEGSDPAVSGSFLRPYTNRWKFFIQKKGEEPVEAGTWTDALETTSYGGRPALKRTQVAEYRNRIRLTFVNVFDGKSLSPFTADYSRSDTGETRHVEFRDRAVTFRRFPGTGDSPAQDYVAKLEHRVLDFYDGMFGVLLDGFPLKEEYEATFPAFDSDRACVDWVSLKVIGRENVEAGEGRRVDTWVVQVETKLYGRSTWWLTREAPYVIQAKLELAEKDGGTTITYKMA